MPIEPIIKRRSVRKYKSDPVSDEDLIEIIKAGGFAPTGHNNQAVEFIVIKNQETKDKLFEITGAEEEQNFLKYAPVLLILVTDTEKAALPLQDLSVASENIFLEAASRGLGTVWKNISSEQLPRIKNLLDIPEKFTLVNIIPIGYPAEPIVPHADSDFEEKKIHQEKW